MKEAWSKKIYTVLLFLLIAFHCVNNYIWLSESSSPGGTDTVPNLNDQMKFYNKLISISSNAGLGLGVKFLFSRYLSLFSTPDPRNNTMHFIPSIANILFGRSLFVTRMTNSIYFIILILAVYFIGKSLADKKIGLLAAFLVSFYPDICGVSRQYEHDFPATAMVALCICLLVYTEDFKNKKYSLFFGISLGLGALFRGQTLFFVIGPLAYILYRIFLNNKKLEFVRFFNLIFSVFLAILISSIWWRDNLNILLKNFWNHVRVFYVPYTPSIRAFYYPVVEAWGYIPFKFFTINWFFFYLFNTIAGISVFFFLIFVIGLFAFLKSKKIRGKPVLMLWIIVPYVIFTIISFKFGHYYFPSFPAIALVSAAGILNLRRRIIKIFLVILILGLGITQFFQLSYGLGGEHYLSVKMPTVRFPWCNPPQADNHSQAIVNFAKIIKKKIPENQDIRVGIIAELGNPIQYFLRLDIPTIQVLDIIGNFQPLFLPDFLIVSSKPDHYAPDYELLRYKYERWAIGEKIGLSGDELVKTETIIKEKIVFIEKIIDRFKNYEILGEALLFPEEEYIFLTARSRFPFKVDNELTIAAADFCKSNNIVLDTEYTIGAVVAEQRRPCFIEYRVIFLSSGRYELWAEYATEEHRPVDILLDNRLIIENGFSQKTGSYGTDTLTWFKEGILKISQPREYKLRLTSDDHIPHIKTIMIKKLTNNLDESESAMP